MNGSRERDIGSAARLHREAQDDWLEAMAVVEELGRKAAAARLRAWERLRLARDDGAHRSDPRAVAMLAAAELQMARARAEADRLAAAQVRLEALRARALERERALCAALDAEARSVAWLGERRCA